MTALRQLPIADLSTAIMLLLLAAPATADSPRGASAFASGSRIPDLSTVLVGEGYPTIGSITISNGNIFDLSEPEEDKALFRLANRIHTTTQADVIRQQLLFAPGDAFSPKVIEETERILRSNRYIQEASIDSIQSEEGIVDIHVNTSDVWTLVPKLQLSRAGGENKSGFGIRETNLFGRGIEVEAMYKSDVDRDATILKYVDHNVGNSWYTIRTILEKSSDGHEHVVEFGKPFYALQSTGANRIAFLDSDRIDSFYDHGQLAAQFRHRIRSNELLAGWSSGLRGGWVSRYSAGLAFEEHRFLTAGDEYLPTPALPDDRKFLYPFVGVELLQDKFETTSNLDQIHRVEDRFLGTAFNARLGLASSGLGSDRDALLSSIGARTSLGDPDKSALFLTSALGARLEPEGIRDLTLDVGARYYKRQSEKRLFFAALSATYGHNLDLDHQILLGGDSGLRGYPLRYQSGDRRVLLTLEQRLFTNWYPFRLWHVGGAIFFDAGQVWGQDPLGTENDGLLKDVGFGLRIGNPRSGLGQMAHIDLAFPLDGGDDIKDVQFLVSLKQSF